jgi:hypothetical protein
MGKRGLVLSHALSGPYFTLALSPGPPAEVFCLPICGSFPRGRAVGELLNPGKGKT